MALLRRHQHCTCTRLRERDAERVDDALEQEVGEDDERRELGLCCVGELAEAALERRDGRRGVVPLAQLGREAVLELGRGRVGLVRQDEAAKHVENDAVRVGERGRDATVEVLDRGEELVGVRRRVGSGRDLQTATTESADEHAAEGKGATRRAWWCLHAATSSLNLPSLSSSAATSALRVIVAVPPESAHSLRIPRRTLIGASCRRER